jgi:hypothetical protein
MSGISGALGKQIGVEEDTSAAFLMWARWVVSDWFELELPLATVLGFEFARDAKEVSSGAVYRRPQRLTFWAAEYGKDLDATPSKASNSTSVGKCGAYPRKLSQRLMGLLPTSLHDADFVFLRWRGSDVMGFFPLPGCDKSCHHVDRGGGNTRNAADKNTGGWWYTPVQPWRVRLLWWMHFGMGEQGTI